MRKLIIIFGMLFSFGIFAQEAEDKPKKEDKPKSVDKLNVVGKVQLRAMSGEKDSSFSAGSRDYDLVDWNFRRVRLGASYESGFWGSVVEIRMENLQNKLSATGAGAVQEANVYLKIPIMKSKLTAGQFKTPFRREAFLASGFTLMTPERAMINNANGFWDIGARYDFKPLALVNKSLENYMTVGVSMTNGRGSSHIPGVGSQRTATDTTLNPTGTIVNSPAYHWRAQIDPFGGLMKDGKETGWSEGNEIFQKETKLSFGIGGMSQSQILYSRTQPTETRGAPNINILNVQATPPNGFPADGSNSTTGLPTRGGTGLCDVAINTTSPCRPTLGMVGRTYDFTFTSHGLYLNGETTYFKGTAANQLRGNTATIGYVIPVGKMQLMPVLRYDHMKGDFNNNGKIDDKERITHYWIGMNLFAKKHDMKVQLFYQIQRDKWGTDPKTNGNKDMNNNLVYFEVTSVFNAGLQLEGPRMKPDEEK